MAARHEAWLTELFGACEPGFKESLYEMLGRLRVLIAHPAAESNRGAPPVGKPRAARGR